MLKKVLIIGCILYYSNLIIHQLVINCTIVYLLINKINTFIHFLKTKHRYIFIYLYNVHVQTIQCKVSNYLNHSETSSMSWCLKIKMNCISLERITSFIKEATEVVLANFRAKLTHNRLQLMATSHSGTETSSISRQTKQLQWSWWWLYDKHNSCTFVFLFKPATFQLPAHIFTHYTTPSPK